MTVKELKTALEQYPDADIVWAVDVTTAGVASISTYAPGDKHAEMRHYFNERFDEYVSDQNCDICIDRAMDDIIAKYGNAAAEEWLEV